MSSLIVFLFHLLLLAQPKRTTEQKPFALTHVTVIDTTGAPAKGDMTVVIAGDRIAVIGKNEKVEIPKEARIIGTIGKFLIPSLWDMHAHFGDEDFDYWAVSLAFRADNSFINSNFSGSADDGILLGARTFYCAQPGRPGFGQGRQFSNVGDDQADATAHHPAGVFVFEAGLSRWRRDLQRLYPAHPHQLSIHARAFLALDHAV